ncbi:hypothetical protein LYSHEL_20250 [Lysobacter helvus]|uniref:CSLREA domain-containing protein n=2 Tax=Lysobacteraceae TaxID=32033 RepID=A0ABN6FYV7_9GAMM|nr:MULTISPECIES: choice-of-anchor Q domain-containing protein [Lysobacter]BCT93002.1 hypothetical protein LYSCAS_20260 [Lysobacter caseinilyticus]BCT96154.1 hypothetical protein LYSHEL_20250 [Lysobacter helvus]
MRGPLSLFVIAAALWLSAGTVHAQARVTNCNDAGPGSLRAVAQSAPNNTQVDLRGLPCNQIVLKTGPIRLSQYTIAFLGPGWTHLTVNGDSRGPVFVHTPPAPIPFEALPVLVLQGFTVSWGRALDADAFGGCIHGGGRVQLQNMQIHHCVARETRSGGDGGYGGAVFALMGASVFYSRIHTSRAEGGDGGGLWSGSGLTLQTSNVLNNFASGDGGGVVSVSGGRIEMSNVNGNTAGGFAGGFAMGGGLISIIRSTIANNHAHDSAGGQLLPGGSTRIIQSTVSGNVADESVGGVSMPHENAIREILNSTITQNRALAAGTRGCRGGGFGTGSTVLLNSAIVSGNTCAGLANDIGLEDSEVGGDGINGQDNIIGVSTVPVSATNTITTNNPRLGALADNGGLTLTQLPLADSQAIDAGNNVQNFATDQRGAGFPRTKGVGTDIGAVER